MKPELEKIHGATFTYEGEISNRLAAVTEQWILPAPYANPAMLEMFRDRSKYPLRDMVPWAGEFAGKYLTHSVQILHLTRDKNLEKHLQWFVNELISLQAEDGYLGPWPEGFELTGEAPNAQKFPSPNDNPGSPNGCTWDAWGHYHIMLGLMLWYDYSADKKAFTCAQRIADLFCDKFLGTGARLAETRSLEMNLAPIHALCLLYQKTKKEKYLQLAREIEKDFEAPEAGDYIRQALAGVDFYKTPKPRWESLHPIQGIAELYFITGDEKYRQAFEQIWWSIAEYDRHNNGGFSSGEQAQGNPYHQGAIETCCTIAWMAMSVDMLRMTGDSRVADEIELSLLNSGIGMMSPSGRWVTYTTPMDGNKPASAHTIVFQSRPGQPELNCCSVNGPRALGMIGDWAAMQDDNVIAINYYGPCNIDIPLSANNKIKLTQKTSYPESGKIEILFSPTKATELCVKLRVPYWSQKTKCRVNGKSVGHIENGKYLAINRKWQKGDIITLELDMSLHFWAGEKECQGKASIYHGPILLAFDPRFNDIDADKLPALDAETLKLKIVKSNHWLKPWMLWEAVLVDGHKIRLCDFGSAGNTGLPYVSWLKVKNAKHAKFSKENPLRSLKCTK